MAIYCVWVCIKASLSGGFFLILVPSNPPPALPVAMLPDSIKEYNKGSKWIYKGQKQYRRMELIYSLQIQYETELKKREFVMPKPKSHSRGRGLARRFYVKF